MSWGRGWEVGVRKAIYRHDRAREIAADILAAEHGTKHDAGARPDLCPKCQSGGLHDATGTGKVAAPSSDNRGSEPTP